MRRPLSPLLCLLALPLAAEPVLLVYGSSGQLLRQAQAVFRRGGRAFAPRTALYGAASATLLGDDARLHPVLFVSGEDVEAGVIEVFVGAQAPDGPDASSAMTRTVHTSTHLATAANLRESGAFGQLASLTCPDPKDSEESPLYDEHGLLAGWHVSRIVDGRAFTFAIPVDRFDPLPRIAPLPVAEWAAKARPEREEPLLRGLGHTWANDFEGGLFYLRKAVEADPGSAHAWFHLGFVEGKTGHGKTKLECYRKAVELDPSFAPARYYLGFSLLVGGDADGAEAEFKRLAEQNPALAGKLNAFMEAAHVDHVEKDPKSGKPLQIKHLLPPGL
jgi:tetratricopeptide (TPR) repeat protein